MPESFRGGCSFGASFTARLSRLGVATLLKTLANKSSKCTLVAAIGVHFSCQSDNDFLR
jgi:hypothetical protein